jgi:uncharacterized protein (TIRG00374 family)
MKKYSRLLIIAILSLIMIAAVVRLSHLDMSWDTLARVDWGWYSLVAVAFYLSVLSRGWRWQTILRAMGRPVGFIYAATLLTAGLFLSAILPARAGDIGRVAMLRQDHRMPIAEGIASIASERLLDVLVILLMAMLGAALALPGHLPPEILQLLLGVSGLLLAGLLGLLLIPAAEQWLRQFGLLRRWLPARLWDFYQKVLDFGFSLINSVRGLGRNPLALAVIVAQSFLVWIWDAVMLHLILGSLGLSQPFSVSLFTSMVSALVTAVPLTPGGLGQYDAAIIGLLSLFGVSTAVGGLAVLLLRAVQLWTFIPVSGLTTYIFGFSRALNLGQTPVEGDATAAPALASTPAES